MVTTKLRDWLFARQRYWGEPIPIVFDDDGNPTSIPDEHLPVNLPELIDWAPRQLDEDSEPEPPLGRATEWATVDLDLGDGMKTYERDLNVMPQWAGSCWYYLRYIDPVSDDVIVEPTSERYWMGSAPADVWRGLSRAQAESTCTSAGSSTPSAPPVQPLLAQGPVRPRPCLYRRAVQAPDQPGLYPGRSVPGRAGDLCRCRVG